MEKKNNKNNKIKYNKITVHLDYVDFTFFPTCTPLPLFLMHKTHVTLHENEITLFVFQTDKRKFIFSGKKSVAFLEPPVCINVRRDDFF